MVQPAFSELETHIEECDVVADEVTDDAHFLRCLSAGLEQVGGEDGRQFFAGHVVEVGTLLDPVCESVARVLVKDAESL